MFSNRVFIIVVVSLFGIANADVVKSGKCPTNIKVVPDFEIEMYEDYWYEQSKYPNKFEEGGKCNTAHYRSQTGGHFRVNHSMVNEESGLLKEMIGVGTVMAQSEEAKLTIVFPVDETHSESYSYWVLATDYRSYSVVYSCHQMMDDQYATYVWILTRFRDPPMDYLETSLAVLRSNHISLEPLQPALQDGCRP